MLRLWFPFRFRQKNKNDLKLIQFLIKKFGYRPKNILLFKIALTHKSVANTSDKLISNERLEFLGDTILDAVIADYLYHKFPEKDEGYLTKVKSKMVNRKTLNTIARKMKLSNFIVYQKKREIRLDTLAGNSLEAIIGAIYLDAGYETAKNSVCNVILKNYVDIPTLLQREIDFKSELFIWAQRNKLDVEFLLIKDEQFQGEWKYEVEVLLNKNPYGRGKGSTKKIAEQMASKETLELIG